MTARGWFLFSLMGVVWGIPYLMIKVAVDAPLSTSMVVFTRCALGAALLLPFAIRGGGLIRTVRTHWLPMLAFACIEIVGPWFTLTDAERHLSSSTAGLLIAGVPIVGVLLARFFGDTERLGLRRVTGLALGLAGVGVLTVPHLTGGDARSLAEVFLTVLGYATAPLIAVRWLKDVPTLQLISPCLALAALVYAPHGGNDLAQRDAVGIGPHSPPRTGRDLHGPRLRRLPGTDQGGRPDPRDGLHVRQPGGRGGGGSPLPGRGVHDGHRDRLHPHPGGLGPGDGRRTCCACCP